MHGFIVIESNLLTYLRDKQALFRLQVAFTVKPLFHGRLEAIEGNAIARFEQPVACRKRVVEGRIVGEVTHGEAVDPSQRTGMRAPIGIDPENGEMTRKHAPMLQPKTRKLTDAMKHFAKNSVQS